MSSTQPCEDHLAITEVLHRYAKAVDTADGDLFASVFSKSGRYHIGGELVEGRDNLRARWDPGAPKQHETLDEVDSYTHAMSNIMIELSGNTATAESLVTSYALGHRDGVQVVSVRSVRYFDSLVREEGSWCISERFHVFQWMFETVPTKVGDEREAHPSGR